MKLEVVVVPVFDVDRARTSTLLRWRLDAHFVPDPDFPAMQMTLPCSGCAIIFGTGIPFGHAPVRRMASPPTYPSARYPR